MTATFDKLYAILRRDLLTTIRHRSGFVLSLVGTFTELAAFYFLSRAIGSGFRPMVSHFSRFCWSAPAFTPSS